MRIVLSILLVLFFTSLTPQIKKNEESSKRAVALKRVTIDYDSIMREVKLDAELIKQHREEIERNKAKVKQEEAKRKKLVEDLKKEIEKRPKVVFVRDTICAMCNRQIDSIE